MEEGIESLNILESAKNDSGVEMGRVCSTHGNDKKWGENFCRKLWRERERERESLLGNLHIGGVLVR